MRTALILTALIALSAQSQASAAKKEPFTGNWISRQYTNGKEFWLRLQQNGASLIGWEGHIPSNLEQVKPDIKGTIKGKSAELEVEHRRGYQAHARLSLRGNKLVWQLLDSDNRSNRYFPLASTLIKSDEGIAKESAPVGNKSAAQLLLDIVATADSLDAGTPGEGGAQSPAFSAYKALLTRNLSSDDPGLQALLKGKNAAGRLYAALILWDANKDAGTTAFQSLMEDQSPVSYKSGCKASNDTVAGVAGSFLKTGAYLDFPSKRY